MPHQPEEPLLIDENLSPYRVAVCEQRHTVVDDQQNEIVVCGDPRSAGHYATLLNKAYERGYRKGYGDARSAQT